MFGNEDVLIEYGKREIAQKRLSTFFAVVDRGLAKLIMLVGKYEIRN